MVLIVHPSQKISESFDELSKVVVELVNTKLLQLKILHIKNARQINDEAVVTHHWVVFTRLEKLLEKKPLYVQIFNMKINQSVVAKLAITWNSLD